MLKENRTGQLLIDYEKATPELMERCTPRQRRLIGDIGEWEIFATA